MPSILSSRSDPESIRLRPVLGWAAADYVYAVLLLPIRDVRLLWLR